MRRITKGLLLLAAGVGCSSVSSPKPPVSAPPSVPLSSNLQRMPDGLLVRVGEGFLKLEVCASDVVRVAYAKNQAFFARKSLAALPKRCEGAPFEMTESEGVATLATAKVRARVHLATGKVSFFDLSGAPILEEKDGGRRLP